jgi:Sulfotransferase domain
MALQVIGAGLGRTGTLSLKLALERLGFVGCYHMLEVLMNPAHAAYWVDAANGGPNWQRIFEGYTATVDYPGCRYWRELIEVYPDAKVVLTVRDPEKWFESTQATIFSPRNRERWNFPEFDDFFEKTVFSHFGEHIHDRDYMVTAFQRHNDEVKRGVPAERLLVFEVKQGWQPLCDFLGVPAPSGQFPHTNSREEMDAMIKAAQAAGRSQPVRNLGEMSAMVKQRLAGLRTRDD